jgi:biotin carboxyl carrier protein
MKEYIATALGAGIVGFLPFLNLTPSNLPAPAPIPRLQNQPIIQLKQSAKSAKRHRVQVQVISLTDLKVVEGSQVTQGQVLSDRTEERQSLEAQKEQIEISVKQLSTPLSQVAELPSGNFSIQEAAIARIKGEIDLLNQPKLEEVYRFKTPQLRQLLETEKLKTQAEDKIKISESKVKLAMELNQAIAALDKARSDYQHQQYQHSLNLIRQQTEMQRQQYQAASLIAHKQEIESKLAEITQIKSPVSGKIRRIKNLGQKDRQISLEIVIDVRQTDPTSNN